MFRTFPAVPKTRRSHLEVGRLRQALLGWLVQRWTGRADMPPDLRMEQRFVLIRWLGLIVVAPALLLFDLATERLVAGYTVLVLASVYNIWVQQLINRSSTRLRNGYITTIGDGVLSLSIILIGGGFTSSFNYVLFTTTMAAAMRYGWAPSVVVIGSYFLLDLLTSVGPGGAGINGDFVMRSVFLLLTVLAASYLQEQARMAEAALARQLQRARALNESSRALSSSLDINTVMTVVADETRRLLEADEAILALETSSGALTFRHSRSDAQAPQDRTLSDLIEAAAHSRVRNGLQQGISDDQRAYLLLPLVARGSASGYVGVVRSRHAPRFDEAERELLHSFVERAAVALENASLYKTIDDRSHDLTRAYSDLAAAHQELLGIDEMKTSFIANVSHELRTPLTSIRSFSELLLSYQMDEETTQEFLGIINTESERLTRLINDVLDITKIEAGHVAWEIEELDLRELLSASARTFANLIAEEGLAFELWLPPDPIGVCADQDRIQQVVANLLGNALKFTSAGTIELSVGMLDDKALVQVRDSGIGIGPEDQKRVFEKFHQVGDTLTDKPKGTGLGLSICRDIVHHHGGEIWVDSVLGQGSTFSFTLPLAGETCPHQPAA